MKKLIVAFAVAAAFFVSGCTDNATATRVLITNGYTNIQITGYSWFGCSEQDTFSTGFTATSPSGHVVSGAVCSNVISKGATIRFD